MRRLSDVFVFEEEELITSSWGVGVYGGGACGIADCGRERMAAAALETTSSKKKNLSGDLVKRWVDRDLGSELELRFPK